MGTLTKLCSVCDSRPSTARGNLSHAGICWQEHVVSPALGTGEILNTKYKSEIEDLAVSIVGAATSLCDGKVRIHLGCTESRYRPDLYLRELLVETAATFMVNGRPCQLVFAEH